MVVSRKGQRCGTQFLNQTQRESRFKDTSISAENKRKKTAGSEWIKPSKQKDPKQKVVFFKTGFKIRKKLL